MPRAKAERETIIRFSPREPEAIVSTDDPALIRRMKRLGFALLPDHSYRVPKEWVQIRRPDTRRLTEEQREHKRAILVQNIRYGIEKRDKRIAA
jgi:hypothetical protein